MRKIYKICSILLFVISNLFILFIFGNINESIKIIISNEISKKPLKYWVGEKYKFQIKKYTLNNNERIYLKSVNNLIELFNDFISLKANGTECLIANTIDINSSICFKIYSTPKFKFQESNPYKILVNDIHQLNLDISDYPKSNIRYKSNNPDIVDVNNQGIITALRPGKAIIKATGLDNKGTQIEIISLADHGLINNYTLDIKNANEYKNLMIVGHPDDEILWGGSNLFKDKYFVVCVTNAYRLQRANDFREILNFTNNSGIILNHIDRQDGFIDDWLYAEKGIIKDLSTIINYKNWEKIVTHGPDGTTGHPHHKKINKYIVDITKNSNIYQNLYYFAKFHKKNEIPKNLKRITDKELDYKIKEVEIYKSAKEAIYKNWFHMLPYENFILATKWKSQ